MIRKLGPDYYYRQLAGSYADTMIPKLDFPTEIRGQTQLPIHSFNNGSKPASTNNIYTLGSP